MGSMNMSDNALGHITLLRIENPLDPHVHTRHETPWEPKKSVADYLGEVSSDVVVSLNGGIIEQERWGSTYAAPGDNVVVCPVPRGGDGGKSVLRVAAFVALSYYAPMAGQWMAANAGFGAASAWTVGAMVAGSMVINSVLPAPMPTAESNPSSPAESPSYGIDGAKNTATEGIPVPVVYGRFRMGGNIIGTYVQNDGKTQDLYMLINAGEGPIAGIDRDSIEINDQPIANFSDVELVQRPGLANQPVIPWFDDTITPVNRNLRITTDWLTHTTDGVVDKLRFDLTFPGGLVRVDGESGKKHAESTTVEIQYRKVGATTWEDMPHASADEYLDYWQFPDGYTLDGTEYVDPSEPTVVRNSLGYIVGNVLTEPHYSTGPITITDRTRVALRRSILSGALEQAEYEVRIRRQNADSDSEEFIAKQQAIEDNGGTPDVVQNVVTLTDVNEIVTENVTYKHTALVALKIRLSDQLNGIPTVTYLHRGRLIRTWDGSRWIDKASNNPAWIVLDALTNARFGGGVPDERIDMAAFRRWAAHCDDKGLTFDGVIDTDGNLWDSLQHVFRAGHAQIVMQGTRYSVAMERADTPVMMFGVGNIVADSFSIDWASMADRANEMEVSYFDKEDGYRQRTIKVYDQAAIEAGRPQRSSAITLPGVVTAERAYQEGLFQLNLNRYVRQSVSFDAPIEAIACTVGDLIYVQHDNPQWGFGGRLAAGSTTSILKLDRPVAMEYGNSYRALVHLDVVERNQGTITNIVGDYLYLDGYDGVAKVKRVQIAGKELAVLDTFTSQDGNGVVVDSSAGLSIGEAYTLYDTDVIEERDVVPTLEASEEVTELVLQSPLSAAPNALANWMFGETQKEKKPFRVKSIDVSSDHTRKISAIEYNASVYDLSGEPTPTPNYSSLPLRPEHVEIIGAEEELTRIANVVRSRVTVSWDPVLNGGYAGADVYLSTNSSPYSHVTQVKGTSYALEAEDGDYLRFKIVAVDSVGNPAPYETAPVLTHRVVGKLAPPSDVTGFTVRKATGGILLEWSAVPDADVKGYELREGPSWDSGEVIVADYAGTQFRAEKSEAGSYTYHIRAIDTGGRYSENPVTVTLELPAPSPVVNFDCIQNGKTIYFRWDSNPEPDVVSYEIREGTNWSTGELVTQVDGTTHTMSSDIPGARTFWIKAIDSSTVYSSEAVFSTTEIARLEDRNVLHVEDQVALGFPGNKFNVTLVPGALELTASKYYGEYIYPVNLPQSYRARNIIDSNLLSVDANSPTWAEATFAWADTQAQQPWTKQADINSVGMRHQMSRFVGLPVTATEGFGLNNSTDGVVGTPAAEATGVTYEPGRFVDGARVNDNTHISWAVDVPSTFRTTFWLVPKAIDDLLFWSVVGASGGLQVGYSLRDGAFFLEDGQQNTINVPFELAVDDRLLVAVVQTETTRKLMVGRVAGGFGYQVTQAEMTPIGSFNEMRLYGL